jgi:hypothetical protein
VPENDLEKLSKILTSGNDGKINYLPFLIHLRTLNSSIHEKEENVKKDIGFNDNFNSQYMKNNDNDVPGIIEQLIVNSTDANGLLIPLRKNLIQNIQKNNWSINSYKEEKNNFEITVKQLTELLKHFTVMCVPKDIVKLITEIGVFPSTTPLHDTHENTNKNSYKRSELFSSRNFRSVDIDDYENTNLGELSKFENKSIDVRFLMKKILEVIHLYFSFLR